MGSKIRTKISDYLLDAKIMIENGLSDAEIKDALSDFGFDESKLQVGKKLYDEMQDLFNKQKKEYGEQYEATEETQKAWEKADVAYIKTLKVARIALQNSVKADNAMMINGQRSRTLSGWLVQAEAFYKNLTSDEGLMNEMTKFGYTVEKLNAEYALVKDVVEKNLKQKKETGEAQEATEIRDKKIEELDRWLSDYRAIVKIALSDNPQKLEKLGILARTEGTSYKKKTENKGGNEAGNG
jgi:hypothetical protein